MYQQKEQAICDDGGFKENHNQHAHTQRFSIGWCGIFREVDGHRFEKRQRENTKSHQKRQKKMHVTPNVRVFLAHVTSFVW